MNKTKNTLMRFLIILSALVAASLACNSPATGSGTPPTAKPMTTEQVQQFEQQLQATLSNSNGSGDVTVTLTQQQINAILASQMAQQSEQTITDPSVILTNGQMEVYAKLSQSGISANLKATLAPSVDANGKPKVSVSSISLGGIPVPDALKSQVETAANNALNDYISSNGTPFKAKAIAITEGQMTITGTRQ